MEVDNSKFDNSWYDPGGGSWKRFCWYFCNALFFINPLFPFRKAKVWLLRLFGAKVGQGVVIKPGVNIKYPWRLTIGNHCWIGERVWIDNLADVRLEDHVCLSQGAMILTGNHDYKKETFDLIIEPVTIEKGGWIGAQSVVCPGVTCGEHAVLSVGSVATQKLEPFGIYQGIPARYVRKREIS